MLSHQWENNSDKLGKALEALPVRGKDLVHSEENSRFVSTNLFQPDRCGHQAYKEGRS